MAASESTVEGSLVLTYGASTAMFPRLRTTLKPVLILQTGERDESCPLNRSVRDLRKPLLTADI